MADSLPLGAAYQSSVEASFAPVSSQASQLPALGSLGELKPRSIQVLIKSGKVSSGYVRVPPQSRSLGRGLVIRWKVVTIPKLFPPPRRAQYRSGYCCGVTVTSIPLAVTTYEAQYGFSVYGAGDPPRSWQRCHRLDRTHWLGTRCHHQA